MVCPRCGTFMRNWTGIQSAWSCHWCGRVATLANLDEDGRPMDHGWTTNRRESLTPPAVR